MVLAEPEEASAWNCYLFHPTHKERSSTGLAPTARGRTIREMDSNRNNYPSRKKLLPRKCTGVHPQGTQTVTNASTQYSQELLGGATTAKQFNICRN